MVSDYLAEYEHEQLNDTKHSDIININYIMDNISEIMPAAFPSPHIGSV